MKRTILIFICPFVLLVAGLAQTNHATATKPVSNITIYVSEMGDGLMAAHNPTNQTVMVIFSDRRAFTFHQAISASGVRYTNETSVFWEHQGEATYSVGNKIIFTGKRVN